MLRQLQPGAYSSEIPSRIATIFETINLEDMGSY